MESSSEDENSDIGALAYSGREQNSPFRKKGYIQSIYHSYGNCGWILFPGSWGGLLLSQSILLVESLQIFILFFISCWFLMFLFDLIVSEI